MRAEIRQDHVFWLEEVEATPPQLVYFEKMAQLRLAINRALFLGLWDLECHLAVYPVGALYKKHIDQFQAVQQRTVTCILYLNEIWGEADGGQLRLYLEPDGEGSFVDILPQGGMLVTFLSADFYHEVLPSKRERVSITGWFKVRTV